VTLLVHVPSKGCWGVLIQSRMVTERVARKISSHPSKAVSVWNLDNFSCRFVLRARLRPDSSLMWIPPVPFAFSFVISARL